MTTLFSTTQFLRGTALMVALGAGTVLSGCSYAQMHGYSVVRTSADARYDPGNFQLLPLVGAEATHVAEFENGLRDGLRASAPEFVPTHEGDTAFAVRVRAEGPTVADGRTSVRAHIEIMDRAGTVTSELSTEYAAESTGATAIASIGRTFGERLAHYLRERERYHHW